MSEQNPDRDAQPAEGTATASSESPNNQDPKLSEALERILGAATPEEREAQLRRYKETVAAATSFMQSREAMNSARHERMVASLTQEHQQRVELERLKSQLTLAAEQAQHDQKLAAEQAQHDQKLTIEEKTEEQKFRFQGLYTLDKIEADTLRKEKWAMYTWLSFSVLAMGGGLIWLINGAGGIGLFALGGGAGALAVAAFGALAIEGRGLYLLVGEAITGLALLTVGLLINDQAKEAKHILLLAAGLFLFSSLGLIIRVIVAKK